MREHDYYYANGKKERCESKKIKMIGFISVTEAKIIIVKNSNKDNFEIIDVRTREEFELKHCEGAKNIDYYDKDFEDKIQKLDRTKKYLRYCHSGARSGQALELMRKLGFTFVLSVDGNLFD